MSRRVARPFRVRCEGRGCSAITAKAACLTGLLKPAVGLRGQLIIEIAQLWAHRNRARLQSCRFQYRAHSTSRRSGATANTKCVFNEPSSRACGPRGLIASEDSLGTSELVPFPARVSRKAGLSTAANRLQKRNDSSSLEMTAKTHCQLNC